MAALAIPLSLGLQYPQPAYMDNFSALTPSFLRGKWSTNSSASSSSQLASNNAPSRPRVGGDELPPYSLHPEPPTYTPSPSAITQNSEPLTLAKLIFFFGFLIPVFWIVGACLMIWPAGKPSWIPSDSSWCPGKSGGERQDLERRRRTAEIKWARRCMCAILLGFVVGLTVGLSVWGGLDSPNKR